MSLTRLVERFLDLDARIIQCIHHEVNASELGELDKEIADVSDAIKEFNPQSIDELKQKISFFIEQLNDKSETSQNSLAVNALVHILNNDFDFASVRTERESNGASGMTDVRQFKMLNAYDLVSTSHDRISIIDRNFRYVNTSRKNSNYYRQKPHDVIGKHVAELIGTNRFDGRAKRYFEKSFGGEKQQYFHSLETENGNKIFSCEMLPLYGSESNVFGSMVAMSDISDLVADVDSIVLSELQQAA